MRCCFVGHRDVFGIKDLVCTEIKRLMGFGVTDFYSGGMGNFDRICEEAVKDLGGKLIFVPYNVKVIKERHKLWYAHLEKRTIPYMIYPIEISGL